MNSVVQAVVRKANQNPTNPTRPTIQLLALGWCKFTFDKVNKVEYEKLENRFVRAPLLMLEKTNMVTKLNYIFFHFNQFNFLIQIFDIHCDEIPCIELYDWSFNV